MPFESSEGLEQVFQSTTENAATGMATEKMFASNGEKFVMNVGTNSPHSGIVTMNGHGARLPVDLFVLSPS